MINGDSQLREFGRFRLDTTKCVLWCEDEPVNLPLKEIELLCVLTESAGQVITKDEIIDRVWTDSFVEESNLTRHIYLLRKALEKYGEGGGLIQTVPRRGYRFTGKVNEPSDGDVVIEKHTSTRTLIEVTEGSGTKISPSLGLSKRRIALVAATATILLISLLILWNRPPTPKAITGPEIRSIAVLPVRSFSDEQDDQELRIRLTDALITRLGGLDRLAIRPTSAVLPFVLSDEGSLEIGKRLQADAVLDSRLQREGDRLRVTIQLVRVATGENMWSQTFDGNADHILDLQDTIAAKVSRSLAAAASDPAEFAKRPTENSEAFEAYLKGRYFWSKRDADSLHKAAEYFLMATTLDPNFSEAFSGLADTEHLLFNYNIDVRPEVEEAAKANLHRALELKPASPDALITLGTIEMGYDWDWMAAEKTLKRALNAAPNSPMAHARYGALLVRLRRFDEAEAEVRRHLELDPLSVTGITNLGMVLYCKKDYAGAEALYRKALELDENSGAPHWLLSRNMWQQGRTEESIAEIGRALELDGNPLLAKKIRGRARSKTPLAAIELLLYEWRMDPPGTNPHNLAYLSTYTGDTQNAIRWLQRSIQEHHPWTSWIAAAPEFECLRGDERYRAMLRSLNLP